MSAAMSVNGLIDRSRFELDVQGRLEILRIDLEPHSLPALTGEHAGQFVDRHVDFDLFSEALPASQLLEMLRRQPRFERRVELLEGALSRQFLRDESRSSTAREVVGTALSLGHARPDIQTTKELADEVSVSVRQLQRTFSEFVGIAPKQWLDKVRLAKIQQHLSGSGRQTNWWRAFGFHDSSHLYKFIRLQTGLTPKELADAASEPEQLMLQCSFERV